MSVENRGLVLVAEDEKPIADLIGMYLRREGFGVHAVATGCPPTASPPAITRNGAAGTGAPIRAASVAANTSSVPWATTRAIRGDMASIGTGAAVWTWTGAHAGIRVNPK